MKIIIDKNKYSISKKALVEFLNAKIKPICFKYLNACVNWNKINHINKFLHLKNIKKMVYRTIDTLTVSEDSNNYYIQFKNDAKFNSNNLIRSIEYGSISYKGYPLFSTLFKVIQKYINEFYFN